MVGLAGHYLLVVLYLLYSDNKLKTYEKVNQSYYYYDC